MKKVILLGTFILSSILTFAQQSSSNKSTTKQSTVSANISRPKLVVGLVMDQMRWDYLYRFYNSYSETGGFKKLLKDGYSCENTFIPYAPSITACGHSSIYTGSVPAINGITGNNWWDRELKRTAYCTEDQTVNTVGSSSNQGKMSPRNMLVTSIADELRFSNNFQGKTIGIAIKDRGAILPAGHSANAAYWYDNSTGNWISSTYYLTQLPAWATAYNEKKMPDQYYSKGWNLLYPEAKYTQSSADDKAYESKTLDGNTFPYDLSKYVGKNYGKINTTPFGNTMTIEFAKEALVNEGLGADNVPDFLTISFSSPDYIGHSYGPNSREAEDAMLRLDADLGDLIRFLEQKVGKNEFTLFLTADHGAAPIPEFLQENKLPGGRVYSSKLMAKLNTSIQNKYNLKGLILSDDNYQLTLNQFAIDSAGINKKEVENFIIAQLQFEPGIDRAFSLAELNTVPLNATIRRDINNGYYPNRSGDIQLLFKPNYIDAYSATGTTHGLWNPYDTHIPLLWYGWGINKGSTNRETYMTDIAATLAALLHIQMPSGCVGTVITEAIQKK